MFWRRISGSAEITRVCRAADAGRLPTPTSPPRHTEQVFKGDLPLASDSVGRLGALFQYFVCVSPAASAPSSILHLIISLLLRSRANLDSPFTASTSNLCIFFPPFRAKSTLSDFKTKEKH